MSSYCDIAPGHPFHGPYHEREYGFPSRDDNGAVRAADPGDQPGGALLAHHPEEAGGLPAAFDGFDIDKVAALWRARDARACWPMPASSATG